MALGDSYEIAYIHRSTDGQNQMCVRTFRWASIAGSGITEQETLDAMSGNWAIAIKPLIPAGTSYVGARMRRYLPSPGAALVSNTGAGAGTRAGLSVPPQLAVVITLRAATAPPRTRGRVYMPSPASGDVQGGGQPVGPYLTAVQTFAARFVTNQTSTVGVNSNTFVNYIFHRKTPQAEYLVTTATARNYFGTQRRRSIVRGTDRVVI